MAINTTPVPWRPTVDEFLATLFEQGYWPLPDGRTLAKLGKAHLACFSAEHNDDVAHAKQRVEDLVDRYVGRERLDTVMVDHLWQPDENGKWQPTEGVSIGDPARQLGDPDLRDVKPTVLVNAGSVSEHEIPEIASHESWHYAHRADALDEAELRHLAMYHDNWCREFGIQDRYGFSDAEMAFDLDAVPPGGRGFEEASAFAFGAYAANRHTLGVSLHGDARMQPPGLNPVFDRVMNGEIRERLRQRDAAELEQGPVTNTPNRDPSYSAGTPAAAGTPPAREGRGLVGRAKSAPARDLTPQNQLTEQAAAKQTPAKPKQQKNKGMER